MLKTCQEKLGYNVELKGPGACMGGFGDATKRVTMLLHCIDINCIIYFQFDIFMFLLS